MSSAAGSQAYVKMIATERRAVGALALVLAFRMFGLFVLLPVLALYASDLPGATPILAGLAVGAFGVTQAMLQIPAGLLSDRIGRKTVIVLGLIVFAVGSVVAAQAESIAGVLTGRVLQGAGAISAATTALVADLTRGEVRTRAMAIVGMSIGATFMLALAVGPALGERIGVVGLFYLGAGLAVIAALIVIAGPGDWAPPRGEAGFDLGACLANRRLAPLHAAIFLLHVMLTATFVALPFVLRDAFDMTVGSHSRVYLLALALSLIGTVPLIIAAERLARPSLAFLAGVGLLAAGQLGLLFAPSAVAVIVALAVFFAGFNFLEARLPASISRIAGPRSRGTALGIFATGQYLGAFAGGLAGGALIGASGPGGVFGAGVALAVGWSLTVAVAIAALKPD